VIRAIISDFGGVLTTPLFGGFARVMEARGLPVEALGHALVRATERHGENPLFDFERGRMTETEFFDLVGNALEEEVGRKVPLQDFAEHYFSHLSPNTEMIEHLRSLRDQDGLRLALLTNNVREWEARWRSMLPDDLFELIIDSAFVGMRKPEPEIYELTLARLDGGLAAGDCLFVDDVEVNCETARSLGMHTVHFRDNEQAIGEIEAILPGR
jgi:putative hydrolase of the HAD superfamily